VGNDQVIAGNEPPTFSRPKMFDGGLGEEYNAYRREGKDLG
jgi:hypothetical protein